MSRAKRIVICGGGAIGVSIAYFLSRRGAQPIVIERTPSAGAASGKSGGFLALDWCRGSAARSAGAAQLRAPRRAGRRARQSLGLSAPGDLWRPCRRERTRARSGPAAVAVRKRDDHRPARLAGDDGAGRAARLHHGPDARRRGAGRDAAARHGRRLMRGPDGAVRGVVVDGGESVEGDAVVIAMGPWSILAARWLPLPAVFGYKGHSLVFETGDAMPAEALFLEYQEASGEVLTPEVFPRADGTTWVCAISSTGAAAGRSRRRLRPTRARMRGSRRCAGPSRRRLPRAPIVARQACFRPVTEDGLPLIGAGAGRRRRLRRDRPQRLGHPQRAGDRRGDGRADPRRRGAPRRPGALRARSPADARSGAIAGSVDPPSRRAASGSHAVNMPRRYREGREGVP